MADYESMNDHELVDIKNSVEREQKRREGEPKLLTYRVTSCMTESMHFLKLEHSLLAMRDVSELIIRESVEDNGKYVNKCTGIVGLVFRVEEQTKAHVDAKIKEGFFDDWRYEERLGELNAKTN
ncbi:DUF5448 family protein [Rahnella sikkimica]|uniref:Uncharacterized protein n=1 Tax=Rahnella sikkimica TaxID=1805933 RepID=A0A2L1UMU8_9GAMM|nr:DUF5448 family protein [Rahnella sikkimica]AVF34267.1 hypothetical protein BV494_04675 [Rahnella sikkimica]